MQHILTEPSKSLCRLVCDQQIGSASDVVSPGLALRNNLSRACYALSHWKAQGFKVGDGVSVSTYSRRLLESSTTALLLRIDPLRVLALRELQDTSYSLSKRNLLSIQWSGDVMPKEKENKDKDKSKEKDTEKNTRLIIDCEPNKLDRALFSNLCSNVIWKPAVEELQTFLIEKTTNTPWQLEFLKIEPEKFSRIIAGQLQESFSFFSKGIHSEWVDRRRTNLNSADCRIYAGKAIKNISFCAASISYSSTVRHQLEPNKILESLIKIENEFGVF